MHVFIPLISKNILADMISECAVLRYLWYVGTPGSSPTYMSKE